MEIEIGEIIIDEEIEISEIELDIIKEYPELENITITPTLEEQHFKSEKYGFGDVIVKGIDSKELNVKPNQEEQVFEGMYYKVTVKGDTNLLPENIKAGVSLFGVEGINADTSDADATSDDILEGKSAYVNNKKIMGAMAINDNNTKINTDINTSTTFTINPFLRKIDFTNIDMNQFTSFNSACIGCVSLESVKGLKSSKVTDMYRMFYNCSKLTDLDLSKVDASNVTSMYQMFTSCNKLTNFKCFKNYGKAFYTKTHGYKYYTLDLSSCTLLTYDSLMSVLNNLYDLNLNEYYNVAGGYTLYRQRVVVGSGNLAKLQATEEGLEAISNAEAKGWDVVAS